MKKNLLYIFADQWKKGAVGFEGAPIPTPNIDRFAGESLVFDQAISTYPLCSPHRAALMTGKYPYSCGMWTNCKPGLDEVLMLKPQEVTIGNVLKSEGYETGYIGKWHLDASEKIFYDKPDSGAEHWDAYTPPGERRFGFDFWYSYGAWDSHLSPHYWRDTNVMIKVNQWSPKHETDVAIDFIKNRIGEKPFCLFLSWNPPHPPFSQVPEKYLNQISEVVPAPNVPNHMRSDEAFLLEMRQYYAAIAGLDEQFGRIMTLLEQDGLVDDTLIVLSADHGEMLGAQGLMGKNVWYEESVKIPLMIRDSRIEAGRSDVLLASQDHMPTLLELLDCNVPDTVQGISFAEYIKGKDMALPEEAFICMRPGLPKMLQRYRERGLNSKAHGWRGIKSSKFSYVINNGCHPDDIQQRWYYDLETDPYQMSPTLLEPDSPICHKLDPVLESYLTRIQDPFLMKRHKND